MFMFSTSPELQGGMRHSFPGLQTTHINKKFTILGGSSELAVFYGLELIVLGFFLMLSSSVTHIYLPEYKLKSLMSYMNYSKFKCFYSLLTDIHIYK